jgi:hypothetical protein
VKKLLINYTYRFPFLIESNKITIGPDNKIKADESNCPTTWIFDIIISSKFLIQIIKNRNSQIQYISNLK